MSRYLRFVVATAVMVTVLAFANTATAYNRMMTLSRGQMTGAVPLSPGDTLTVYFVSDGRPYTVTWWDNAYYYSQFKPFSAMSAYVYGRTACYWLRNAAVQWIAQSSTWTYPVGWEYMFVIRNNTNGDWVYIQIR